MRGRRVVGALALLVLAGCSSEPAPSVSLPSATTSAPSSAPTPAPDVPPVDPGDAPPTIGLPTQARATLADAPASAIDPALVTAWKAFVEARAESLRAHRVSAALRDAASADVADAVGAQGPADRAAGRTVSLRPLGRLDSVEVSGRSAQMVVCLWQPTVAYFVEADGEAVGDVGDRLVREVAALERTEGKWIVTSTDRDGSTCSGGKP